MEATDKHIGELSNQIKEAARCFSEASKSFSSTIYFVLQEAIESSRLKEAEYKMKYDRACVIKCYYKRKYRVWKYKRIRLERMCRNHEQERKAQSEKPIKVHFE